MIPQILVVAGARPNFMKVAPLLRAFERAQLVGTRFVHTGQHYDHELDGRILRDLGMDRLLEATRPAAVLVVGDVTSTLGAALAASSRHVPILHVEAGLRSGDWTMPEERNRVIVDRLSQLRFATEASAVANLESEDLGSGTHLVGNCMIDSLLTALPRARASTVLDRLGLGPQQYAVLTLHRPSNVDHSASLDEALESVAAAADVGRVVFPVHPRTRAGLEGRALPPGLLTTEPMGYIDFVSLLASSALCLTDSGGIQEETTALGIPCITLRRSTERPITVESGTNELVYRDPARVRELADAAFSGRWKRHSVPELWDGGAAERIAAIVADWLCAPGRGADQSVKLRNGR